MGMEKLARVNFEEFDHTYVFLACRKSPNRVCDRKETLTKTW